jgi:hypothetical protein
MRYQQLIYARTVMKAKFIGLRDYSLEEIEELKRKYPRGLHKTHKTSGEKLPYNGLFITETPIKQRVLHKKTQEKVFKIFLDIKIEC